MSFEFKLPDCCQVLVFRSILQLYDDRMKFIKAHIYLFTPDSRVNNGDLKKKLPYSINGKLKLP